MKINREETPKAYRYYVMKTQAGVMVMRVEHQYVEIFLRGVGTYVMGTGDTADEAVDDFLKGEQLKENGIKRRVRNAMLDLEDEIRITILDLRDWLMRR